jgi:hypothetical protein
VRGEISIIDLVSPVRVRPIGLNDRPVSALSRHGTHRQLRGIRILSLGVVAVVHSAMSSGGCLAEVVLLLAAPSFAVGAVVSFSPQASISVLRLHDEHTERELDTWTQPLRILGLGGGDFGYRVAKCHCSRRQNRKSFDFHKHTDRVRNKARFAGISPEALGPTHT